jgi:hypothetical protein
MPSRRLSPTQRVAAALARKKGLGGVRGQGGKLARSEIVTVRLDPRLRYLADLAARKKRRTLSSYIEWAIEQSLAHVRMTESEGAFRSIAAESGELWDVDEAERFVKLALLYPELLAHSEQVLWKLIRENKYVWRRSDEEQSLGNLNIERLRQYWDRFVVVAAGDASKSVLPDQHGHVEPLSS